MAKDTFDFLESDAGKKDNTTKKALIGGGATLGALGVVAAILFSTLGGGDGNVPNDKDVDNSVTMKSQEKKNTSDSKDDKDNITSDADLVAESEVDDKPEWLQAYVDSGKYKKFNGTTWYASAPKEDVKKALDSMNNSKSDLVSVSSTLLPEEAGFTSDDKKAYNEDGTLNPMYSYWTKDQFAFDTTMILQMLTNPDIGEWGKYQLPGSDPKNKFNIGSLSPIFSSKMINKIEQDGASANTVPLLLDWDNNEYGMSGQFPITGYRWYGHVDSTKTTMEYDDSTSSYKAKVTSDITYEAVLKNGDSIEKKGKLVLDLIAGTTDNKDGARKVLVDNASLTMEG